nr:RHS repeat-associated core domain-containing protein [Ferrimonas sediminum]
MRWIAVIGFFCALQGNAIASTVALQAEFRVNEQGSATYQLPLILPKARGEVAPQVSLSYTSSLNGGYIGVGFSLRAHSTITRCQQTPATDGALIGVDLTATDRFCLDGQRLILATESPAGYGEAGSIYRTEVESFIRVTAQGTATAGGPLAFKVESKDGDVHYYGDATAHFGVTLKDTDGTATSSTAVFKGKNGQEQSVALFWAQSGTVDPFGNYISYHYENDSNIGEHYLQAIAYGGHGSELPYHRIDFGYTSTPKPQSGYIIGSPLNVTRLLSTVTISTDGQTESSYHLAYNSSSVIEERTYLTSIKRCAVGDTGNCSVPINFDWNKPTNKPEGSNWIEVLHDADPHTKDNPESRWILNPATLFEPFSYPKSTSLPINNRETAQFFDMTGDGLVDMVYSTNAEWKLHRLSTGSTLTLDTTGAGKHEYAHSINFSGNGQRDLLVADSESSDWHILRYDPVNTVSEVCDIYGKNPTACEPNIKVTNFEKLPTGRKAIGLEGNVTIADPDGDGLEDILFIDNGKIRWYQNTGGAFAAAQDLYTFGIGKDPMSSDFGLFRASAGFKSSSLIDINSDGRTDLVLRVTESQCFRNGDVIDFVHSEQECVTDHVGTWVTDRFWRLYVADGNGLSLRQVIPNTSEVDTLRVTDFNGDGLTDIAYVANNEWRVRPSTGYDFGREISTGIITDSIKKYQTYFVDLNNDGRSDILVPRSTNAFDIFMSIPTAVSSDIVWLDRGNIDIDNTRILRFADAFGEGKLSLFSASSSEWYRHDNLLSEHNDTISRITDGYGVETRIEYARLTDIEGGNAVVYPTQVSSAADLDGNFAIVSPMLVVKRVATEVNDINELAVRYEYGGLTANRSGRGLLGFEYLRTIDEQTGIETTTVYEQSFPKIGLPKSTTQRLGQQVIHHATTGYDVYSSTMSSLGQYVLATTNTEYRNEIGFGDTVEVHTSTIHDNYGNPEFITVTTNNLVTGLEEEQTVTTNLYEGYGGGAAKGRLSYSKVTKRRNADMSTDIERESSFVYNSDGILEQSITAPNDANLKLVTTYGYDKYGNRISESVEGGINRDGSFKQIRTSTSNYGSKGRYPNIQTNSVGETVSYRYNGLTADAVAGVIHTIAKTDPNGQVSIRTFDEWGREIKAVSPDGTEIITSYDLCGDCSGITGAHMAVLSRPNGAPATKKVMDRFGRQIGQLKRPFDDGSSQWIVVETQFDNLGRVSSTSEPGLGSPSSYATSVEYDVYSRVIAQNMPHGAYATSYYQGLTVTAEDDLGNQTITQFNALGEKVRVTDQLGGVIEYDYDAYGNLVAVSVTPKNGHRYERTTALFDDYGRKYQTFDPDKGTWHYQFNAFGELISQTNGRAEVMTLEYDVLGRKIKRVESEGLTCWEYGTAANGTAGFLVVEKTLGASETSCTSTNVVTQKTYEYYDDGKLKSTTSRLNDVLYTTSYTYDAVGRVHDVTYPNNGLVVRHHYNENGYLVKRSNASSGKVYQTISAMDVRGNVTGVSYGNGVIENKSFQSDSGFINNIMLLGNSGTLHDLTYSFDSVGNLSSRDMMLSSASLSWTDSYDYDELYRLTLHTTNYSGLAQNQIRTDYDDLGNIQFKEGVGYYKYDNANPYRLLDVCADGWCDDIQTQPATESCAAGYTRVGNSCEKVESKAANLDYAYYCPVDYILSGTTCSTTLTEDATHYCATSGYTLSGDSCIKNESKTPTYSCPSGYTLNGTSCSKEETKSATVTYSCPSGYSRSGTTCTKTVNATSSVQTIPEIFSTASRPSGPDIGRCFGIPYEWECMVTKTVYSCPSGYTKSGTTCTSTLSATPIYSCSAGWTKSGASCSRTLTSTATASCSAGWSLSGNSCTRTLTQSVSYTCSSGWSLSGQSCSKYVTQDAEYDNVYYCDSGWSLSGQTCSRTVTQSLDYSCPSGWGLSGTQCTRNNPASYLMEYDDNGNVLYDGKRDFTYTSYDLISRIDKGSDYTTFKYDGNRARYYRYDKKQENGAAAYYATTYVDGLYEKVVRTGASVTNLTEHKYYVGNVIITDRSNGSDDTYYLHKDHQGSTTTITDDGGNVIQQFVYDAWGKLLQTHTDSLLGVGISPSHTKGYTGHENIENLDIIHMNGRIYDPTLGRFLQADPHIQAPDNLQNYNRYSYVMNNPMSYTDPSGFFFKKLFKLVKKYWKVIAAVVVSYFTFGAASNAMASWALGAGYGPSAAGFMGAAAGGAAAGFASGAILTGSLKGALQGAFVGAVTAGLVEGIAQYGFGTSTIGEAAQAMAMENAGIPKEMVNELYGRSVSDSSSYINRFNGDTAGLDSALEKLNIRIKELPSFKSHQGAAKWLHDNALSISSEYNAEVFAKIYTNTDGGYSIGKVITSYDSGAVYNLSRSTAFRNQWGSSARWHTHPVGSKGLSTVDLNAFKTGHSYLSFQQVPGHSGIGLQVFDAKSAWSAFGNDHIDMPIEHGDKFTKCVYSGC